MFHLRNNSDPDFDFRWQFVEIYCEAPEIIVVFFLGEESKQEFPLALHLISLLSRRKEEKELHTLFCDAGYSRDILVLRCCAFLGVVDPLASRGTAAKIQSDIAKSSLKSNHSKTQHQPFIICPPSSSIYTKFDIHQTIIF